MIGANTDTRSLRILKIKLTVALSCSIAAMSANSTAADQVQISAECRGAAAGVVAAMKASGELTGNEASSAAIVAARRACQAALDDLGGPGTARTIEPGTSIKAEEKTVAAKEKAEEPSIWDLLTRDRELKPGNERLRRLKTQ